MCRMSDLRPWAQARVGGLTPMCSVIAVLGQELTVFSVAPSRRGGDFVRLEAFGYRGRVLDAALTIDVDRYAQIATYLKDS